MSKIVPHLWYDKEALEAAKFYTSLFEDSEIVNRSSIDDTPSGTADMLVIRLAGQEFMLLGYAGLKNVNLSDSVEKLSYGQRKMLEIVRSLLSEPAVLLLDEPAAGLNSKEMEYIVALIKVAIEWDIAVLLIEHSMDLVMGICDQITVLNFGHQIASGTPAEIQENQAVIDAYLGGSGHAAC